MLVLTPLASKLKLCRKVNCVDEGGTFIRGVSSSLRPLLYGSGEKTELEGVSLVADEVTQTDWPPVAAVDQAAGNAGTATESKFSESRVDLPMTNGKDIVPRFAGPSCN